MLEPSNDGKFTLISGDWALMKGSWVTENFELSVFDILVGSTNVSIDPSSKTMLTVEQEYAVWNPSVSFDVGEDNVSIDFYVIGKSSGWEWNEKRLTVGLGCIRFTIEFGE